MGVRPTIIFPYSTELQAEGGNLRAQQTQLFPPGGNAPTGENDRTQNASTVTVRGQDEVKLQWQPPDETVVYQFVNQQGSLIFQVPSEQQLNLGREIAQELAQEATAKAPAAAQGEKDDGS
jgi:hypothetical protein